MASGVALDSPQGRGIVTATVLGSAVAMLTGTVVNVALPTMAADLRADAAGVQWILNAYLLPLAALILLGGALGDRYGRRRLFLVGTAVFGLASLACALAPGLATLLAARALQGIGGALLTPASLAIIEAVFLKVDRAAAIGSWSGLGSVAAAIGPLLGGGLVELAGWRLLFLINLPVCVAAVAAALRWVPETSDDTRRGRLDAGGALTGIVALGALTFGLIRLGARAGPLTWTALAVAVAAGVAFVTVERRAAAPLVPPHMFANTQFAATNALTFVVYAALGGVFFLLVVHLQVVLGFSPLEAGAATLPTTGLIMLLSARAGRWATRSGPRRPLTAGSLLIAAAMVVYATLGPEDGYVPWVLVGATVFGLGLAAIVAPVTAAVLAAADDRLAGTASGVNNAVARTAGLLAVAVLPVAAGMGGADLIDPAVVGPGFRRAMLITAALSLLGSAVAFTLVDRRLRPSRRHRHTYECTHCGIEAPPTTRTA